jgi:hypothetical protein
MNFSHAQSYKSVGGYSFLTVRVSSPTQVRELLFGKYYRGQDSRVRRGSKRVEGKKASKKKMNARYRLKREAKKRQWKALYKKETTLCVLLYNATMEDNIKMYLQRIGYNSVNWIQLLLDMIQWRTLVIQ